MKVEVHKRVDGRWAWRVRAENGQIIATDGGQGYENKQDAVDTVHSLLRGDNQYDIVFVAGRSL